jgi:hypothetical protein
MQQIGAGYQYTVNSSIRLYVDYLQGLQNRVNDGSLRADTVIIQRDLKEARMALNFCTEANLDLLKKVDNREAVFNGLPFVLGKTTIEDIDLFNKDNQDLVRAHDGICALYWVKIAAYLHQNKKDVESEGYKSGNNA